MMSILFIGLIGGAIIGIAMAMHEIVSHEYFSNGTYRLILDCFDTHTSHYIVYMLCAVTVVSILFWICHAISGSKKPAGTTIATWLIACIPFIGFAVYYLTAYSRYDFNVTDMLQMFFFNARGEERYPFITFYLKRIALLLGILLLITPVLYAIVHRITTKPTFKKHLLRLAVLFVIVFCAVKGTTAYIRNVYPPSSPNIVVIVIDTLRADHLPFYGYHRNTAPFLSGLVKKGVLFKNAYAGSSWTAPSTATLFTSYYPFQHGVVTGMRATLRLLRKNNTITLNRIPSEITTITEILKNKGYNTFGISDNLNIGKAEGFTQGFDLFETYQYQGGKAVNETLKKWAPRIKKDKFFLYLQYMDPHKPYHRQAPWFAVQNTALENDIAAYDSEINYIDTIIEELFDLLSLHTDTFVIVTSDHGEAFEEHGHSGHGKSLYNEEVHIPLLLYFPDGKRTATIEQNVSLVDILPTISQLAGCPHDPHREGVSLINVLDNDAAIADRSIYIHLTNKKTPDDESIREIETLAILRHQWKYIQKESRTLLFNLLEDPWEQLNAIISEKEHAESLKTMLNNFLNTCFRFSQAYNQILISRRQYDHLRSLGYTH